MVTYVNIFSLLFTVALVASFVAFCFTFHSLVNICYYITVYSDFLYDH